MKIFHCDHCQQLIFFENFQCISCHSPLAYLSDLAIVGSLQPDEKNQGLWNCPAPGAKGRTYRLCQNYQQENVCNWALPSEDSNPLCLSCRLTRVIPNLNRPGHKEAWYRLEVAKRRVVYSLLNLGLPGVNRTTDARRGLAFEFLADEDVPGGGPVLTGHNGGVIIINIAEADDAEREKRRRQLNEPFRTLLGHFRHEIGHYYWDRLIKNANGFLMDFRDIFGDERQDYGQALREHHAKGPPADWQQRFISSYASAHPWEDWAETWAHYLHMTDALETAAACGLTLKPRRADEPALKPNDALRAGRLPPFQRMIDDWFPLTYVLNNLNRGLGLPDGYPFVLSTPVIAKLKFVHKTIDAASS